MNAGSQVSACSFTALPMFTRLSQEVSTQAVLKLQPKTSVQRAGFDEEEADDDAMFGGGFYFTDVSSTANQYVNGADGCSRHEDTSCYKCERKMLLCRVILGKTVLLYFSNGEYP